MISIQNISKTYQEVVALNDISLNINESEFFGVIGPDGAGKTTLLRIICSLILPSSGSCQIGNLDVVKDYKEIRKIIGYVPGKFSLYPDLSVEENLNFFAGVFQTNVAENYHLIKDIYQQIEEFKDRKAGKLSGGMKQKLALSCALIHKPKILVLDEPATGVDAVARVDFWNILKSLQKQGITIIVSTPYMDDAANCDKIALLQKSNLLQVDTPQTVISQYNKELIEIKVDNTYECLKVIEKIKNIESAYIFGSSLHVAYNTSINININEILKNNGITNAQINKIEPSIEDCFLDLMKN